VLAPSGERVELPQRVGPPKAVNREDRNRLAQIGHPIEPCAVRVKADGVNAESAPIEPCEELDHLTLGAAGFVAIDEDGDGDTG
jgi:hypothetical protein